MLLRVVLSVSGGAHHPERAVRLAFGAGHPGLNGLALDVGLASPVGVLRRDQRGVKRAQALDVLAGSRDVAAAGGARLAGRASTPIGQDARSALRKPPGAQPRPKATSIRTNAAPPSTVRTACNLFHRSSSACASPI